MKTKISQTKIQQIVILLVFVAPLIVYWVYYIFISPPLNYYVYDPEFQYFLNSLGVFKGVPYNYLDHPGTPLEIIGTVILGITRPFLENQTEGFFSYHIQNPWLFLNITHYLLILANIMCIWLVFSFIQRSESQGNVLTAAALATMYFASHPLSLSATFMWDHNSLSFPFGTILLIFLYQTLTQSSQSPSYRTLILLGLGAGIMAAITIYMLAWLGAILVSLFFYYFLQKHAWKKTVLALLLTGFSGIAGFFLAVLPAITRMPRFWRWIVSILTHQSNYLAVAKDEPMATRLFTNFMNLYEFLPYLVISVLLLIGLAVIAILLTRKDKRPEKNGLVAIAGGVSLQIIIISLIFLDRPIRPLYFLSVATMTPFLALCVLRMFINTAWINKSLNWILIVSVIFGLFSTAIKSFSYKQSEIDSYTDASAKIKETVQQYAQLTNRDSKDIVILWMYGTYSQCWGLWFANRASAEAFTREIVDICPNQYEFMGRVSTPYNRTPLEEMNWDIIFTCEKYVDAVMAKDQTAIVQKYPNIEWTCGKMAIIYNK